MIVAWVVGGKGLLGSALCRALKDDGVRLHTPTEPFCWHDTSQLIVQIPTALKEFSSAVGDHGCWEIYWAAGIGTMSSPQASLTSETVALSEMLRGLESDSALLISPGSIAFASSAGAIYAGSKDDIITENSSPAPTTAYAHEKLHQEALIRSFTERHNKARALIARISTLFGVAKETGKRHGLLAHMARNIARNTPTHIYVPFDTTRDYIAADDAATEMICSLRSIASESPGTVTRIIASERPTTVAEIFSTFRRVARRAPRIVTGISDMSGLYPPRMQFRSVSPHLGTGKNGKSLLVGVAELIAAERQAYAAGPERAYE